MLSLIFLNKNLKLKEFGNFLRITDLIYSGKSFNVLFVWTLYSTHCLLLHDKLSLIIERNQPQQFDQGCSHLTLHVNVLILKKEKKKKCPLSFLWPILARWRRKAEKRFVPYGILLVLLQEKGLAGAELSCFSLGKEKTTKQNTKFFIHVYFFVRTLQIVFCESYVILNVRELLYFRTNNLLKGRKWNQSRLTQF